MVITRYVHNSLLFSSEFYSLTKFILSFIERYVLLYVLKLYLSQSSSRFDELPDDFDPSGRLGSFDDGDPQTTNLYVGNLSPKVCSLPT